MKYLKEAKDIVDYKSLVEVKLNQLRDIVKKNDIDIRYCDDLSKILEDELNVVEVNKYSKLEVSPNWKDASGKKPANDYVCMDDEYYTSDSKSNYNSVIKFFEKIHSDSDVTFSYQIYIEFNPGLTDIYGGYTSLDYSKAMGLITPSKKQISLREKEEKDLRCKIESLVADIGRKSISDKFDYYLLD